MKTLLTLIYIVAIGTFGSMVLCYVVRSHCVEEYEQEIAKVKASSSYQEQVKRFDEALASWSKGRDSADDDRMTEAIGEMNRLKGGADPLKEATEFWDRWTCYSAALICFVIAIGNRCSKGWMSLSWTLLAGVLWFCGLGNISLATVGH